MADEKAIVSELITSYWMEMETVQNYIANATNLDGVRAVEIKEALVQDIDQELGHAKRLASRIHVLGGMVPGSADFEPNQTNLQPPKDALDLMSVIKGVISAEEAGINQYKKLIGMTEGVDYVTQDLCITLLADEEEHRREFLGFLREYDRKAAGSPAAM